MFGTVAPHDPAIQPIQLIIDDAMTVPLLTQPEVDLNALRTYRLARFRDQLAANNVNLAVLTNPVSLRYVADWREYQTFTASASPTSTPRSLMPSTGTARATTASSKPAM